MAGPQGKLFYVRHSATVTFRVEGRGTMALGLPLRQTAEGLLADGVREVRIDLRGCKYMDSTFIGTLLSINKQLGFKNEGPLIVVSPSDECVKALVQMGLDTMLPSCEDTVSAGPWLEVDCGPADLPALKRNITQAHEELASLPGSVGKQFEAVIRCLANGDPPPPPQD